MHVIKKLLIGKEINISSGVGISIAELLNKIAELMGVEYVLVKDPSRIRPKESEVDRLIGNSSLINSYTGWKTKTNLDRGLELTIKFYLNHKEFKIEDYVR